MILRSAVPAIPPIDMFLSCDLCQCVEFLSLRADTKKGIKSCTTKAQASDIGMLLGRS